MGSAMKLSFPSLPTHLKALADWMKERDVNMTQLMGVPALFSASPSSSAAFLPRFYHIHTKLFASVTIPA